jgi:hypothetical protein
VIAQFLLVSGTFFATNISSQRGYFIDRIMTRFELSDCNQANISEILPKAGRSGYHRENFMLDKIYQYSYNLLKLIHSFDKSQWVL